MSSLILHKEGQAIDVARRRRSPGAATRSRSIEPLTATSSSRSSSSSSTSMSGVTAALAALRRCAAAPATIHARAAPTSTMRAEREEKTKESNEQNERHKQRTDDRTSEAGGALVESVRQCNGAGSQCAQRETIAMRHEHAATDLRLKRR